MRARIRPTLSTALVASLLLGGCTATPDGATPASPPADAGAPAAAPTVDVDGFHSVFAGTSGASERYAQPGRRRSG